MEEELTSKMHNELSIDSDTEISHRVSGVVEELNDSDFTLNELLDQYDVTLEQYNKYRGEWEGLFK